MDSDFRKQFREAEGDAKWAVSKVLGFIIILTLLLGSIGWVVHLITAPARAVTGVVDRTLNADNIIANYEWFKQTYQDVLAIDIQIANAERAWKQYNEANPSPRSYAADAEVGRLGAIALGLYNQRANLVAQYNARSQMVNRSLFKSHNLPEVLQ